MVSHGIKIVFGGAAFMGGSMGDAFTLENGAQAALDILARYRVSTIDTAQLYGDSEIVLGTLKAADTFTIDTKALGGFQPGTSTREGILSGVQSSLKRLGTTKVDVLYLHCPDPSIPLIDTLRGVDDAYRVGYFKRFGLSNYRAEDVRKVHDICKSHDWVLPTVYQGNYSAFARKQESVLFPVLRELDMSFYAYSPLAGGFLAKSRQDVSDKKGRFDPSTVLGGIYAPLYARPALIEALDEWEKIGLEFGIKKAEMAYRWVTFNSALEKDKGDAIIIGPSTLEQLEETLQGLECGPLAEEAVKRIDQLWIKIEHEAPLDNYNG